MVTALLVAVVVGVLVGTTVTLVFEEPPPAWLTGLVSGAVIGALVVWLGRRR